MWRSTQFVRSGVRWTYAKVRKKKNFFKQIANTYEREEKKKEKKEKSGQTEANAHGQVGVIWLRFYLLSTSLNGLVVAVAYLCWALGEFLVIKTIWMYLSQVETVEIIKRSNVGRLARAVSSSSSGERNRKKHSLNKAKWKLLCFYTMWSIQTRKYEARKAMARKKYFFFFFLVVDTLQRSLSGRNYYCFCAAKI